MCHFVSIIVYVFLNICGLHFFIYNLHVDVRREKVGFRNCFFDHAFSIANDLMQNCPQGQVEFLEGNTNNSVWCSQFDVKAVRAR